MSISLRLSARCFHALVLSQRQSTLASVSRSRVQPVGSAQFMATWTDRLKRWQSGGQKDEKDLNKDEHQEQQGQQQQGSEKGSDVDIVMKEKEELLIKQGEKINALQDKYMRALAETENVRQRILKQVEEAKLFGIQSFSKDILEVADILEKATESVPQTELNNKSNPYLSSLFEGLKMTESELQKALSKNGLVQINPIGEMFDPAFHEALCEVPGERPGTIALVSRVGYTLHGRTIRPARVGVVKASESTAANNTP